MAYFFKLLAVILVGGGRDQNQIEEHTLFGAEKKKLTNNSNFPEASGTIKERHLIN